MLQKDNRDQVPVYGPPVYGAFPLQRGAVPGPFLVAFPLGVVPASGYFFTVFWLSKIEVLSGPTTGLSMLN